MSTKIKNGNNDSDNSAINTSLNDLSKRLGTPKKEKDESLVVLVGKVPKGFKSKLKKLKIKKPFRLVQLAVLMLGLFTGLALVKESQDVRRSAHEEQPSISEVEIELSFEPTGEINLNTGETVTVKAILNTNSKEVSTADLRFTLNGTSGAAEIIDIAVGDLFPTELVSVAYDKLTASATLAANAGTPITGSGTLVKIEVRTLTPGENYLRFESSVVTLLGEDVSPYYPYGKSVKITSKEE